MVRITKRKKKIHAFPGPNQCHPRVGHGVDSMCLPSNVLVSAGKKLGISSERSDERSDERSGIRSRNLGLALAKHLGVDPTKKRAFLMSLPLTQEEKQKLATDWLRPAMPEGWKDDPDMWLNSNDIKNVMTQYEEAYPNFKFLGPYPIDFAAADPYSKGQDKCLIGDMCSLNFQKESLEGKKCIGIIYNLDPHYKDGSHWVANFINIPKKQCYYFDSYGMKPPKQVYKFMQWLGIQEPKIKLGWNGRRFQYSNTECGMYCMYFLDRMIAGEAFLRFCRRSPPDSFMLDMRDWMFSE